MAIQLNSKPHLRKRQSKIKGIRKAIVLMGNNKCDGIFLSYGVGIKELLSCIFFKIRSASEPVAGVG